MTKEETLKEQITGEVFIYSYFKQNHSSEGVLSIKEERENHWTCQSTCHMSLNIYYLQVFLGALKH